MRNPAAEGSLRLTFLQLQEILGSLGDAWGVSESPPRSRAEPMPAAAGIRTIPSSPRRRSSGAGRAAREPRAAEESERFRAACDGNNGGSLAGLRQLPRGYEGDLLTTLAIYEPG